MTIYKLGSREVNKEEFWQNNTGGVEFSFNSSPKIEINWNEIVRPHTFEEKTAKCAIIKLPEDQEKEVLEKIGMSTRHKAGNFNPLQEVKQSRVHSKTEEQIHKELNITKEDIENLNLRSLYKEDVQDVVFGVIGQIFTPVDSFKTLENDYNRLLAFYKSLDKAELVSFLDFEVDYSKRKAINFVLASRVPKEKANKGIKHSENKLPIDKMITVQFPKAVEAICKATLFGHNKYKETDGDMLNFKRVVGGSQTYADALQRHNLNKSEKDKESNLPHIYHKAWNAMAELELWIEENENN